MFDKVSLFIWCVLAAGFAGLLIVAISDETERRRK